MEGGRERGGGGGGGGGGELGAMWAPWALTQAL